MSQRGCRHFDVPATAAARGSTRACLWRRLLGVLRRATLGLALLAALLTLRLTLLLGLLCLHMLLLALLLRRHRALLSRLAFLLLLHRLLLL